jgi:hypothetical protein
MTRHLMNYGKGDQHLSNTSEISGASVTSNEMMGTSTNLTLGQMKEYFLDTHQEVNHVSVTIKGCRRLLKALISK